MLEAVKCWDHAPDSPGTLRIHLGNGKLFMVTKYDSPGPDEVRALLALHFGPTLATSNPEGP